MKCVFCGTKKKLDDMAFVGRKAGVCKDCLPALKTSLEVNKMEKKKKKTC
jgi:hypothetical protein